MGGRKKGKAYLRLKPQKRFAVIAIAIYVTEADSDAGAARGMGGWWISRKNTAFELATQTKLAGETLKRSPRART